MKKLLSILVVFSLVLSFSISVFASSAKVEFEELKYFDADKNEIPAVREGFVETQVTANLNGTTPQSVFLIVLLCDKETGKIKAVDYDNVTLSGGVPFATLEAGVTINNLSDEVYRVYLWDGLSAYTPLDNCEPAAPENVYDIVNKPSSIELSWDEAYDDFDDVASYKLYRDGNLISSGSDTTFIDKNLDKNTKQNYSIVAIDGEGLESEKMDFSFTTSDIANAKMSTDDPTNSLGVEEENIWMWLPTVREATGPKAGDKTTYGYTEATEAGGRACRVAPEYLRGGATIIGRFTYKVNPEYINADDSDLIIDVTYFDEDTQRIEIAYTSTASTDTVTRSAGAIVDKTGTGLWKVVSFRVASASFHHYFDDGTGYGNFRFWQATPGLKVSDVAVSRRSDYDGDPAGLRVKDVPEIRDVIFYMDQAEMVEHEGVNCVEIDSTESLDFDITDTRLNGKNRVNVEIEYLDEGNGEIVLEYMSDASVDTKTVELTDSGEWKKTIVSIDNADFAIGANLPVSTDDLVIKTTSGQPFRVKSVRVYEAQ